MFFVKSSLSEFSPDFLPKDLSFKISIWFLELILASESSESNDILWSSRFCSSDTSILRGFFFLKNLPSLSLACSNFSSSDWFSKLVYFSLIGQLLASMVLRTFMPCEVGVDKISDYELTERVLPKSSLFFWEKSMIVCMKLVISPLLYSFFFICWLTILITYSHFSLYCSLSLKIYLCSSDFWVLLERYELLQEEFYFRNSSSKYWTALLGEGPFSSFVYFLFCLLTFWKLLISNLFNSSNWFTSY